MNDKEKNRQPMFMRASVSSAFDERLSKKGSTLTTLMFVGFIILIIALIIWIVFFDGVNYAKNFITGIFGPEVK